MGTARNKGIMKPLRFKNPANGYIIVIQDAEFWAFILGPLYFAAKGVWKPLIFCLIIGFFTLGLSILVQLIVLPMYAQKIFTQHFLMLGWVDVTHQSTTPPPVPPTPAGFSGKQSTPPEKRDDGIPTYQL